MMESCFLQVIGNIVMKIHGNKFSFPFWNWKRLQQTCWVLMLNLYLLKFHAPWNIFSHVLFHSWPKILLPSCSNCLLISWVTRIWSLMDFIHHNSPQIYYIRNINYSFKSEKSIFFQFISLIPLLNTLLLQFVFYLLIQFISSSMTNNLLLQIWLANTKGCRMHFPHLPAECINYPIFLPFYVLDFEIKLT